MYTFAGIRSREIEQILSPRRIVTASYDARGSRRLFLPTPLTLRFRTLLVARDAKVLSRTIQPPLLRKFGDSRPTVVLTLCKSSALLGGQRHAQQSIEPFGSGLDSMTEILGGDVTTGCLQLVTYVDLFFVETIALFCQLALYHFQHG
jgi:hypothetical protein